MSEQTQELRRAVAARVARLTNGSPSATADLARLRRGLGKKPGELPELWELTLEGPSQWSTSKTDVARLENALYTSLTLFALHQQSKAQSMHVSSSKERGWHSIGTAAKSLAQATQREKAANRHMNALATAATFAELSHHAKALISQFRQNGIPLDYATLAEDLYWLQNPRYRANVLLRWGRDYYSSGPKKTDSSTTSEPIHNEGV